MKFSTLVMLSVIFKCHCLGISKIKDTKNEMDKPRSVRVHRVSTGDAPSVSIQDTAISNDRVIGDPDSPPGWKLEKFLSKFPANAMNVNAVEEHEEQFLKQLKLILKEFFQDGPARNFEVKVNKVTDALVSVPHGKPVLKSINSLKDLLDSPEELNIYRQDDQRKEKHVKSRYEDTSKSFTRAELMKGDDTKMINILPSGGQHLDDMLTDVQNQIGGIRHYLHKLCREFYSGPSVPTVAGNSDNLRSFHQPKKVSIF